jgi:hypothetical protein
VTAGSKFAAAGWRSLSISYEIVKKNSKNKLQTDLNKIGFNHTLEIRLK